MARETGAMPRGDLFALTWEIPHEFGGLTKSMLQRSCQLATHLGRDVSVLTLAHQPDLGTIRADLVARGLLVPGVSIRNVWEDLLVTSDEEIEAAPFDPSVSESILVSGADGVDEVRRGDGSVLARQHWVRVGTRQPLTPHGDQVTRTEIFSSEGMFLGGWNGAWSLWRWWLRVALTPGSSHLIVDNGLVADCLAVAPLPDIATTYLVHNGHVAADRAVPYGRLDRWRAYAHHHLAGFDAVVYLTETQRRHVELLIGPQAHSYVVPHAIEPANAALRPARPPGSGIVMANIDRRKRVDHAVQAVTRAAESVPSVEMRVFGRGAGIDALEHVIKQTRAPVKIEGYTSDPSFAFAASSYSLLTSTREGFGLVLIEAMAAGSLPIAYDIPYGPADIIEDGVSGFLVPPGDIDSMAAKIVEIASASPRRLRRLRRAARRRARSFSVPAVVPLWGAVFMSAEANAARRLEVAEDPVELAEHERTAALYRLRDCHLEAVLLDVTWAGSTVTTTVSCTVEGAGSSAGTPTVEAVLVHEPTGSRTPLAARPANSTDRHARVTTAIVDIDVDLAVLPEDLQHVLYLTARIGSVEVGDTVVASSFERPWLELPPATPRRPVMLIDRRAGLRLVTASPHVASDIQLDVDHAVALQPSTLTSHSPVEAVEATGLRGSPTLAATATGPGSYGLRVDGAGLWKLRARVDGRWRDVAWRGPGDPPGAVDGLSVELTARGYLRLRRDG